MRIDEGIQADLWSITMGIFNLGNVSFKKEGDGFASIDPKSTKFLEIMAGLWGIEPKAMVKRLTTANMKVCGVILFLGESAGNMISHEFMSYDVK